MNSFLKIAKYLSLIILLSVFTAVLSKFIFEHLMYKHRDLSLNIKVQPYSDFKLVVIANKMPGRAGSFVNKFKLEEGKTSICNVPVPKEVELQKLTIMTRPENSSFLIEEIRLDGFYKDLVWTVDDLAGALKSHSLGLEQVNNYTIEENGLRVFLSNESPVLIIQPKWANLFYSDLQRDGKIFAIIICLLTFISLILFRQKLLFWVDIVDGYSLMLTSCFLVFLFIPFFSNKELNSSEKRTLAPFPELNQLVWKIPKLYSQYYNDHFPFRNQLMNLNSALRVKIFNTSPLPDQVSIGKEGWLFLSVKEVRHLYRGDSLFSENQLERIKRIAEEKAAYLKGKNSDFYFIIPPSKPSVYPELLPVSLKKHRAVNKRDQVMKYLKENSAIKVIDPLEMLLSKKDSIPVYYKTDTHWNQLGGFFAYQMIMRRIAEDHPNLSPLSLDQYNVKVKKSYSGDLLAMINLYNVFYRDSYHLSPNFPAKTRLLLSSPSLGSEANYVVYMNEDKSLPRLLMLGDSFAGYLRDHMSNHFSYAGYSRTLSMETERIKKAKPDIVVYEIMERFIDRLLVENSEEIREEAAKY